MEGRFDLHHEFYAIFLSIWASFVIRPTPFVFLYALWVLFAASLLLYALHRGFHTPEPSLRIRTLDFHIEAIGFSVFAGIGIHGLGIRLLPERSRPSFEECLFLVAIVILWIVSIELTRIRAELEVRREVRLWRR